MSVTRVVPDREMPGFPHRRLGQFETFAMSAMAPAAAVLFTNPFDTTKVRLQLQGQTNAKRIYTNSFDAFTKIFKSEGIAGLQRGLTPAMLREGSKNWFRIVWLSHAGNV
jgi:solute carrier family 25 protein 34/35